MKGKASGGQPLYRRKKNVGGESINNVGRRKVESGTSA